MLSPRSPWAVRATSTTAFALVASLLTSAVSSSTAVASPTHSAGKPRPSSDTRSVTLITGDRFVLDRNDDIVSVDPAEGREDIGFRVERTGEHMYAIPTDAERLIGQGTADRRLFDLKALLDGGYDDARRGRIPLVLGGSAAASFSATRLASQPVPDGTVVTRELPAVRGAAVEVDKNKAEELWKSLTRLSTGSAADGQRSAVSGVRRIWLDAKVRAAADRGEPRTGAPAAGAAGGTGKGVKVAVLDTGIDSGHPDLTGKVVAEKNFTSSADAGDHFGHGSHVASIVAGSGAASDGTHKGVAPDAQLLNGKVLDDEGSGETSGVIAGMQWAADQGAKVINMSLGAKDSPDTDPLEAAVAELSAKYDTLFVVAAGNGGANGDGTINSPGSADAALTVGAVDGSDALASFSSKGPRIGDQAVKPDITAPGVHIVAARAAGTSLCQDACVQPGDGPVDDNYTSASGTSMATPYVAGAAAIVASEHPDVSGERLKSTLMASARPRTGLGAFQQGAGQVDIAAATDRRITSEPGSLSFGLADFPHTDDEPVTRTLTYRNSGDQDTVLDLTASTTDRTGSPVNDGTFTVSPDRITVPAGGTATATVTSDTRVGPAEGQLSGTVTATAAGTVVTRTPLGAVRESEAYDVTLRHIGSDGNTPTTYGSDTLYNLDTHVAYSPEPNADGTSVAHVPPGRYHVNSSIVTRQDDGTYARAVLYRPEIVVDGGTSLTLDARDARPVDITLPDRKATASAGSLIVKRNVGDGYGITELWVGSFANFAFAQLDGAPTTGSLQASISGLWARPEAWDGADTPQYRLAYQLPDTANAGLTRRLTREDLARIDSTIASPLANRWARVTAVPHMADGTSGLGVAVRNTPALPRVQTDYVNADASWSFVLTQTDAEMNEEAKYYAPRRLYQPGRTYRTGYGVGVFGPGHGEGGNTWGLYRTGDSLDLTLSLYTDGLGHPGSTALSDDATARTTLVADGSTIFDNPSAPFVDGLGVPSRDVGYTLTTSVTQSPRTTDVSTRVDSTWTFRSATVTSGTQRIPLLNVRYTPSLAPDSSTPATRRIQVPVTVEGATGGVRSLSVSVSYDEGKRWERVPVTAGRVLLAPAKGAESVSLRAAVMDARGNTARQTIVRAFKLTPAG